MTAIFCVLARLALCAFGFTNRDVPCDIGVCLGAHLPKACPEPTKREPIPQELKDKMAGLLYSSVYAKEVVITNEETQCNVAITTINKADFIYIDFYNRNVQTKKTDKSHFAGPRLDDGQTKKYMWLYEDGGVNTTYTLLSVRDSYSVFVDQDFLSDGSSTSPNLYVLSKAATLTADKLAEIEQTGKDNGIEADMNHPQNFKCPKRTA